MISCLARRKKMEGLNMQEREPNNEHDLVSNQRDLAFISLVLRMFIPGLGKYRSTNLYIPVIND